MLTTAAAIAMFALSSVARADTFTLTGINGTGVTAQVSNYSLVGNTFTFTIKNTSVAPGSLASRISSADSGRTPRLRLSTVHIEE